MFPLTSSSPREELRLGPHHPGGSFPFGLLSNGTAGCRPTLIEPERLKDFGEEHLLNGDVKVIETKVVEAPEVRLMEPPKTRRVSEFRLTPKPQYLRFEDISAAAFRIQTGIQKTPCTVDRRDPRLLTNERMNDVKVVCVRSTPDCPNNTGWRST